MEFNQFEMALKNRMAEIMQKIEEEVGVTNTGMLI